MQIKTMLIINYERMSVFKFSNLKIENLKTEIRL